MVAVTASPSKGGTWSGAFFFSALTSKSQRQKSLLAHILLCVCPGTFTCWTCPSTAMQQAPGRLGCSEHHLPFKSFPVPHPEPLWFILEGEAEEPAPALTLQYAALLPGAASLQ